MAVYVTGEELEKILFSKIEPIENSLNFNGDEFNKLPSRVETLEKTATNIFYSNRSLTELEDVINNSLKFVSNWIMANLLSLNVDKTNLLNFSPLSNVNKSRSQIINCQKGDKTRKNY